jgi:hypothetical protein
VLNNYGFSFRGKGQFLTPFLFRKSSPHDYKNVISKQQVDSLNTCVYFITFSCQLQVMNFELIYVKEHKHFHKEHMHLPRNTTISSRNTRKHIHLLKESHGCNPKIILSMLNASTLKMAIKPMIKLLYIECFHLNDRNKIVIHVCAFDFSFELISISFFIHLFKMQLTLKSIFYNESFCKIQD